MPTESQLDAVIKNGAGLAQDTLIRRLLATRYLLPADPITEGINSGWLSHFFDKEGLLRPEVDYYIDWEDFCKWFDKQAEGKVVVIPKGTAVGKSGLEGLLKQAVEQSFKDGPIDIPEGEIYHFNFLTPRKISTTPIQVLGLSLAVQGNEIQVIAGGRIGEDSIFFSPFGDQIRISKKVVDYIDNENMVNYANNLFDLAPFLHSYIKSSEIELLKKRTNFSSVKNKIQSKKKQSRPQDRIQFRVIRRVKKVYLEPAAHKSESQERAEPQYRVKVQGFWRKLTGIGKGPDGLPVVGKTWVRNHTRWNEKPDKKTVWIKEPLFKGDKV